MTMKMRVLSAAFVAGGAAVFFTGPMRASDAPGHEGRHGSSMPAGKMEMPCPADVEGAQVKVDKTKDGVVITITAKDPEAVKMIQIAAAHMGLGRGKAGCAHCGQKAAPGSQESKVYVCSMGCYKGPNTKDGRCPKCGMNLEPAK